MKKQLIIIFFTAMIVLAGAYSSNAEMIGHMVRTEDVMHEEGMPPMREMKHPGIGMMGEDHPMWISLMALGLDENQKEAMKEIKSRVMKEIIKKRADERIAGIELKELIDKDSVDMKAVETKLKKIEALKTEMHLSFIKAVEEAKSKLTPEQRKEFRETHDMEPLIRGRGLQGAKTRNIRNMPPPPGMEEEDERP